jgi:hypothetical protein
MDTLPESGSSLPAAEAMGISVDVSNQTTEAMRQQIHTQRRRRAADAKHRSKRKKLLRKVLIFAGEAVFLLLLIYTWYKVANAIQ